MITKRVVSCALVAASLLACACGGGGGGGPAGPSSTEFRGSYDVEHLFIAVLSGLEFEFPCDGSLSVTSVNGTAFSGSLTIEPCEDVLEEGASGPISGTLSSSGAVTLTLAGQENLLEALEGDGCTVVSADSAYRGTFSGGRLRVALEAVAQCDLGQLILTHVIDARRT